MTAGRDSYDPKRAPGYREDFKVRRDLALELRRLRIEAGLNQGDAAAQATITASTWSNMEIMRYPGTRLDFLMTMFRVVGKRVRIVLEDIPGPDDTALEEVPSPWVEEESSGTSSEETMGGELVRPDHRDEEESLRSLARRAFEESQERVPGV